MKLSHVLVMMVLILISLQSQAEQSSIYQVSLLRAAPGSMPELIELVQQRKSALKGKMLIMRHSQGDHWDLMLLKPITSLPDMAHSYQAQADFQHDFVVSSDVNWQDLSGMSKGADLFHIEMFQAAKGLYGKLLEQRNMENDYLVATQRNANLIFETKFGSDTDLFTLGIYEDLKAFAADPDLASEVFEIAAKDAGFVARSDIGFYLRRFLVGHQDTLATQIQ
jgi:hypothetical protein